MQARRVDVVQYGWNMFDRRMQAEVFPYCEERSVGVMAYGSLAYGLLAGAFTQETTFGADDWRSRAPNMGAIKLFESLFGADSFPRNIRAVGELKELAASHGKSLAQLALRWTTSNPVISTALVGCRNVAEVEDNVGAIGWTLGDADLTEIDAIFERNGAVTTPDYWIEEA